MSNIGLYIHIPFCRRKCLYCDFYSLAGREMLTGEYADAVIRNIRHYDESYDTVYFGGGTPSLMSPEDMGHILSAAHISDSAEISMEANPDSADSEKLLEYRRAGINRISFGVQSLADDELRMLGRLHDSMQAKNVIRAARAAGFDNISADIMLGLPYQKAETIRENINGLAALGVDHISAYMLKIEEGTPLSRDEALCDAAADDDAMAENYEMAVGLLAEHGYAQYEISNFAKAGYECRHNLKYWRCEDYIGIGPSAHSCYGGKRFSVPCDMERFIAAEYQETEITDDAPCGREERMMLALRLNEGYEMKNVSDSFMKEAELFRNHGLVNISGGRVSLTVRGMLVSNEIICRLTEKI